ncbi:Thiamine-monophosphate kinase [Candidatus Terasakiella magnetica]|uniref:Thiamine-monophosphate kinase n=1 Tax=Candidatus Terasakiella magnetica TaxID=1867952 RepID=A0A1C3RCW5_9PROT|nr:thiamine-phosphate kinase [Candidatus Terasakiella magnetica]SCA55127.1 Thiamine-monophosphate kinase [Candidatus Terasakiella magnetica]
MLGEFEQIAQIMAPLAQKAKGAFALKNDAAVFHHGAGEEIVVTTDTLVAGVHFFANDAPVLIAKKLLGVNLSDLASMGARPTHYTLNASYPKDITTDWIKSFASGLGEMQDNFDICLLGGDTTHTIGPLTLSLTAFGTISQGMSLPRLGARVGDLVCVSGTIGDAALGLLVAQGKLEDQRGHLLKRYHVPIPRIHLGQELVGLAKTCLDISDGLVTDMAHMQVGIDIELSKIPLSKAAQQALEKDSSLLNSILNGGDDYELLFTIAPEDREKLLESAKKTNTDISIIGRITEQKALRLMKEDGTCLSNITPGYRHF